jgi:hypothetical protein
MIKFLVVFLFFYSYSFSQTIIVYPQMIDPETGNFSISGELSSADSVNFHIELQDSSGTVLYQGFYDFVDPQASTLSEFQFDYTSHVFEAPIVGSGWNPYILRVFVTRGDEIADELIIKKFDLISNEE